jgi:hypothetical protein
MKHQYDQLSLDKWPDDLTCYLAVLKQEPLQISAHAGVIFSESFDNLDYFTGAILRLPNGVCVSLTRHKNSPETGTVIMVVEPVEYPSLLVTEILNCLGLREDDITWRNPVLFNERSDPQTSRKAVDS